MSKIGAENLALTNDDMGAPQFPDILAETEDTEIMEAMRLWELSSYTDEELINELNNRMRGVLV